MDTDLVIKNLYDTSLEPFVYYTVGVNGQYRDYDGHVIRESYDYDLVKIEFMKSLKEKYKPTIMLWNNNRITVLLNIVNYGDLFFSITGHDEYHREWLAQYHWFNSFVENGGDVEEGLMICNWIKRACITESSVA